MSLLASKIGQKFRCEEFIGAFKEHKRQIGQSLILICGGVEPDGCKKIKSYVQLYIKS
jgi:hypothetical protein